MLENKIKELSKKMVLAATVVALNFGCLPGATVPSRIPSPNGYVSTGENCCSKLDCTNYDGCKTKEEEYNPATGIFEVSCCCYNREIKDKESAIERQMRNRAERNY